MTTTLRWHDYRYMPYEKRLAALEVERLTQCSAQTTANGLLVDKKIQETVARRFTYVSEVVGKAGDSVTTDQARLEASTLAVNINRKSAKLRRKSKKQVTRYSAHGLHEYRGKFNPQIVRATSNILGLKPGALVLDPFSGSGTVLLESAHLGFEAIGFDLHPLAIQIANAKITAVQSKRSALKACRSLLIEALQPAIEKEEVALSKWINNTFGMDVAARLPNLPYLREWFPEIVLKQIAAILVTIDRQVHASLQGIFKVILSDIVREVSWQEPADLRIRRRANPSNNYPAIKLFIAGLEKKLSMICGTPDCTTCSNKQVAVFADSRNRDQSESQFRAQFGRRRADAVITSPPYATALPYVDMHRLSLCLLGLITDREIREAERSLIGNREIATRERRGLEDRLVSNSDNLPESCHALCATMLEHAQLPGNGFRRRNTPSLLYKYLVEMRSSFTSISKLMKKNAPIALVVGPNRCSLGGIEFAIDTPDLLRQVAEDAGLTQDECIELETYQRYDLHKQNSIRREVLLILRS